MVVPPRRQELPSMEIDEKGRERIAELVRAQMGWSGVSGPSIQRGGRVSRATVDRVKRQEEVSEAMLRALGDVLGLPRDYLLYVGRGDVQAVERSAASDPDLLRWTLELIQEGSNS
jgi:hypothetical protein